MSYYGFPILCNPPAKKQKSKHSHLTLPPIQERSMLKDVISVFKPLHQDQLELGQPEQKSNRILRPAPQPRISSEPDIIDRPWRGQVKPSPDHVSVLKNPADWRKGADSMEALRKADPAIPKIQPDDRVVEQLESLIIPSELDSYNPHNKK